MSGGGSPNAVVTAEQQYQSSLPWFVQEFPGQYTATTYNGQPGWVDATGQIVSGTNAVLYRPPGWQEQQDALKAAHPGTGENFFNVMGSGISAMASNPVVQAGALLGAGAYFLGPVAADLFGGSAGGAGGGFAGGAGGGYGGEVLASLPTEQAAALGSANQAVASGLAPGSVGAASAAAGALTPAELAAASGTTTLGNIAAAAPAVISANQAVASGMSPGSVGAAAAAAGALTPAEQAAASGVVTAGSSLADIASAASTAATAAANGDPSLLDKLKSATGLTGTQLAALASGATSALTAANTSKAISEGLKAQTDATTASQGILKGIYNEQLGFQKPYQATGLNALNQIGQMGGGQYQQYDPVTGQPTTMGTGTGYLTHQFDKNDLAAGLAPNYDFMLQQGQMANQRAANVGGGALSGNTLQGLQNYTQNYAGNAYQNAFQNYQTQRNNIYNNLSNMAGIGQTANTGAANAGTSYGTGVTGLNTGLANATAASILGQAQVAAGGANSAANATFLSSLLGQTGKVPATTPTTKD